MKMTIIIKFDSDESDGNDGVEDKARFHNYDEPRLASHALFLMLDTDQGSEGRSISMEDLYNKVAIGDDQRFDHHILGSADHPTGTATKELHQSQLLKSNQSQRSIVLYKITCNHPTS